MRLIQVETRDVDDATRPTIVSYVLIVQNPKAISPFNIPLTSEQLERLRDLTLLVAPVTTTFDPFDAVQGDKGGATLRNAKLHEVKPAYF